VFDSVRAGSAPPFTPGPGDDAIDPIYPEIRRAEGVQIITGAGPNGENVLDLQAASGDDYQTAGIQVFGHAGVGGWDASQGRVRFVQKWTSTVFNDMAFAPLWYLTGTDDYSGGFAVVGLGINNNGSNGTGPWEFDASVNDDDFFAALAFLRATYVDTWVNVEIGWICGSPGRLRCKINGVVIFDIVDQDIHFAGGTTADSFTIGFAGLMGPITNIVLENIFESTPAPPLPPVPLAVKTSAAPIPCIPSVQTNNGGRGKSGCNIGGSGWTPLFSGAPGTVPMHADPTPGELLNGKTFDAWVELDVQS
jgi:hypothetical protein